jgi:hypothetical protein
MLRRVHEVTNPSTERRTNVVVMFSVDRDDVITSVVSPGWLLRNSLPGVKDEYSWMYKGWAFSALAPRPTVICLMFQPLETTTPCELSSECSYYDDNAAALHNCKTNPLGQRTHTISSCPQLRQWAVGQSQHGCVRYSSSMCTVVKIKEERKREYWVHPIYSERPLKGKLYTFYHELRLYYNQQVNSAKSKYNVTKLKLLALIFTLKQFKRYLYKQQFKVYTNYKTLK